MSIILSQKNAIFHYSVAELIEELKKYPQDLPVLVSGYEGGFENIVPPVVEKLIHKPGKSPWDGEFQEIDDDEYEGSFEAVVLRRIVRSD